MDTLQIFLLGSPEVVWKGEVLRISRHKSRALLFYLAFEGRASRGDLRELFWPEEEDEIKARANLRVALTRLRAGLPQPDVLDADHDTIALDRGRVAVDALRFLQLAEPELRTAGLIAPETPLPERVVQQLRLAAGLWRAPLVLSGFSFADDSPRLDHWQLTTARRLEDMYLRVLTRLADHFAAAGDFESALSWTREALQSDPWADELHLRLLRWLQALGRGAAAAAYIQDLLQHFARENLEISPALAQFIRRMRQDGGNEAPPEPPDWPVSHLARVALVGRAAVLQALLGVFRRGGMAVMWGEAGMGKTRLAYEVYRSLQPRPRLLLITCLQGEHILPFQPLADALRRMVRPEEWRRLNPVWLRYLVNLLPELADLQPETSAERALPVEKAPSPLYEALRQLMLEISRSGRMLLVLDGAQWCDESTLAAMAYLNERRLFRERGLLLVTARPEEPALALERWTEALSGSAGFQQVSLPAFDRAESAELAQRVLGQPVPPGVVQRLVEDTGGNPLFLQEILFALLEYSPAVGLEGALAQLPLGSSLQHLLRQRLARLSPEARQVAGAASVLRAEFTPDLLAQIAQVDLESVTRSLDELIQARLIQPAPGRPTAAYGFIHGQTRDVMRGELGLVRRRLLHLQAAQARSAQESASQYRDARLAYHYEQAGELLPAFHCWVQACRYARSVFAIHEALQAFQAAEQLVPVLREHLSDETLYDLYSIWSEITAYDFSNIPFKQQLYTRLLRLGEERRSPLLIGGALSDLAILMSFQNDLDQALDTFRRAAYQLETLADPVPAAQNEYRQAWCLISKMRYAEAALMLEKAMARLEQVPAAAHPDLRVNLAYRLGMLYLLTGWPEKADRLAAHALRQQASSTGAVYGHLVMAGARFYLGDHAAAREHVRLGQQLAAAMGSARMTGLFYVYQLRLELACGELDAVWEHAQAAAELAAAHKMPDILCIARTAQGEIFRILEDWPSAIRMYQEALQVGKGQWDSLSTRYRFSLALVDSGQVEAGLQQVEEAYGAAYNLDLGEVYIPALSIRALLLARTGRLDEALRHLPELTQVAEERRFVTTGLARSTLLIQDAMRRGDEPAARRLAGAALQTTRALPDPFWELHFYRLLAGLGPLAKPETARVQELLNLVAQRTRDPELRPLLETFLNRTRAALLPAA